MKYVLKSRGKQNYDDNKKRKQDKTSTHISDYQTLINAF